MNLSRRQAGLSLLELLLAMSLSVTLVAGASSTLVLHQRQSQVQRELARLQENARLALFFLLNDIRAAARVLPADAQAGEALVLERDARQPGEPATRRIFSIDDAAGSTGIPALFVAERSGNETRGPRQELVQGVESLTFQYGVETASAGHGSRYIDARAALPPGARVRALRIKLEMRSLLPVPALASSREGNSQRYLRRRLQTTVALRARQ